MDIIKNWLDGAPYVGANPGIDPGQMGYWNDGAPFVNFYEAPETPNLLTVLEVSWSNIGRILETNTANISKVIETDTYV